MGNNKDDKDMEKTVYEEWRTYPPVPENKIKTEILLKSIEDIEINVENLFAGKNKIKDG